MKSSHFNMVPQSSYLSDLLYALYTSTHRTPLYKYSITDQDLSAIAHLPHVHQPLNYGISFPLRSGTVHACHLKTHLHDLYHCSIVLYSNSSAIYLSSSSPLPFFLQCRERCLTVSCAFHFRYYYYFYLLLFTIHKTPILPHRFLPRPNQHRAHDARPGPERRPTVKLQHGSKPPRPGTTHGGPQSGRPPTRRQQWTGLL